MKVPDFSVVDYSPFPLRCKLPKGITSQVFLNLVCFYYKGQHVLNIFETRQRFISKVNWLKSGDEDLKWLVAQGKLAELIYIKP